MDRKMKQTVIGTSAALLIILIVVLAGVIKALTPSKEVMPLNEYFNAEDGKVALILQDQIYEKQGLILDGMVYIDYDTIVSKFNHRFYWDSNENILTYTTPTEVIRTEVGSKEYSVNKSKSSVDYPIVKTSGDEVYIALEFVVAYSDIQYELYEKPDRVVIQYQWGEFNYATVKKENYVRTKASIKSPRLTLVKKDAKLLIIDTDEEMKKGFKKVMTKDGIVGYIQEKYLNSVKKEEVKSTFKAPTYPHITKDYKINLVWHQVTNQEANNNLPALMANTKGVTTISPTWFSVSSNDGQVSSLASETYVQRAHNLGLEVWGLVKDFDTNVSIMQVLSHTSSRDRLVNELVANAIKYNLDGINVDFEKIKAESAVHYLEFLRELSIKCRNNGLVLSVDNYVPAPYNSFYDLKEQGIVTDYVIIMGYDEHHGASETSGSVSSMNYFNTALTDTLKDVDKERVIMAMPFYTRVWKEVEEAGETKVTSSAYAMQAAWDYMASNGCKPKMDEETGQYYAEFKKDGATYKCWFEEEKSIESRMKSISEADVAGVAAWRLGFEKASVWNVIMKYMN